MMPYGDINAEIPAEDVQAIKESLQQINDLLPFIVNLSSDEKRELPNIGNRRHAFVQKSIEIANNNTEVVPGYFDMEGWQRDFNLYNSLRDILGPIQQLVEKIEDTEVAVSSEAYRQSLQFKELLESANRNQAGLDTPVDELEDFFDQTPQDDVGIDPMPA